MSVLGLYMYFIGRSFSSFSRDPLLFGCLSLYSMIYFFSTTVFIEL